MRSITHRKYGEPANVLRVEDAPDPGSPKGDEVLIRIGLRPINLGALLGIRGRYRPSDKGSEAPPQPTRIGVEE